jgi:hypothetical protein
MGNRDLFAPTLPPSFTISAPSTITPLAMPHRERHGLGLARPGARLALPAHDAAGPFRPPRCPSPRPPARGWARRIGDETLFQGQGRHSPRGRTPLDAMTEPEHPAPHVCELRPRAIRRPHRAAVPLPRSPTGTQPKSMAGGQRRCRRPVPPPPPVVRRRDRRRADGRRDGRGDGARGQGTSSAARARVESTATR